MKNTTMTNPTQITRVRFAFPQAADLPVAFDGRLAFDGHIVGVRGASYAPKQSYVPMHKTLATKDVPYLRSWRPPV